MKSDLILVGLENLFFKLGLKISPFWATPMFTGPVDPKLFNGIDVVKPPGVIKLPFLRFF